MKGPRRRRSIAAALLAVLACLPAATTPARASSPALPCRQPALLVRVTPPTPAGPAATLVIQRRGEGMGGALASTCVLSGAAAPRLIAAGERAEVPIAAPADRYGRVHVQQQAVLLPVEPGGTARLGDHPCFGWQLSAPWLDPFAARPPLAYCRAPEEPCRDGYAQAGPPGPVEDPLCAVHTERDSERRCVKLATVRFEVPKGAKASWREHDETGVAAGGAVRRVVPALVAGGCPLPELRTPSDRALVALPVGGDVVLEVDARGAITAAAR